MRCWLACLTLFAVCSLDPLLIAADPVRDLQQQAVDAGRSDFGHWGWDPENYLLWGTHSNRLIPIYTFGTLNGGEGIDLTSYLGKNSPYHRKKKIIELYGDLPEGTLHKRAPYCDQTNLFDLQQAALRAGKKHIILVIFDGMDWQTTRAASIYQTQSVQYDSGRGMGLHFQDYTAGGTTQFGWMVTSPECAEAKVDVDTQSVEPADGLLGGYAWEIAGAEPWSIPVDRQYPVGKAADSRFQHAYTDSSSSATSMTAGIKTFNSAVNVDSRGEQVRTIAHLAQEKGYKIGVVTSVPISHATPAAAYSHNVDRDDYQDLTRDLLGLKSVSHPDTPLPGVDLLLGCGYGIERSKDNGQGKNFVPGNAYLTEADRQQADIRNGGKYTIATRTSGAKGGEVLRAGVEDAKTAETRFFGYFGAVNGHLPFRTANGDYQPVLGRKKTVEKYTPEDISENPTLAEMAEASLDYLSAKDEPFWLMVEAGDVDWANHDNNIDCSIGAVISGDLAVKAITDWVEQHSSWDETVMIVTADHGHYLNILRPEMLIEAKE